MQMSRHSIEAQASWKNHQQNRLDETSGNRKLRHLKSKTYNHHEIVRLERNREEQFLEKEAKKDKQSKQKYAKKHMKNLSLVREDPGIQRSTVHGMMIDAGSTGSRLHLYEWDPRILSTTSEVQDAVSGKKISFPSHLSRWTDRLRPGVASFASLPDDKLDEALAHYLSPLIDFAKTILQEKEDDMGTFPIFFRATAGMRALEKTDRFRIITAIQKLFSDKEFCPFYFENEYARILSGEEEAIFDWTGINFAMGNLVEESEGAGAVINPKTTYGALDMGGASTQIAFYEPHEDIMANLFKLQLGQGKHWNLYAHSFMEFGMNEARSRFQARLIAGKDDTSRLVTGIHNPCLPGGGRQDVRLDIHIDDSGMETNDFNNEISQNGFYQAILKNDDHRGDFEECMTLTKAILNLDSNAWCDFAHNNECSFNGIYMPDLPNQEFLAFSNYFHVWEFLDLPMRASLQELYDGTNKICSMTKDELLEFNKNHAKVPSEDVEDYCFRSSYTFNVLRNGFGFRLHDNITATEVINGHKVSWAVGAMLYEINTLPWEYEAPTFSLEMDSDGDPLLAFVGVTLVASLVAVTSMFLARQRRRVYYEPLKTNIDTQPVYS